MDKGPLRVTKAVPIAAPPDRVDEEARDAALGRLCDRYSAGELSYACFRAVLEQLFAARGLVDLESAMQALPPLVRLTPSALRLAKPLVLHAPDGGLQLGSGWQLAEETTIRTGVGSALLDLTAASWDTLHVSLHLETWGSIEVLVPEGVAVQMAGGAGRVRLEALSAPVPGGPVLRISTSGPAGVIRIRHSRERHNNGPFSWLRRRRTDSLGLRRWSDRRTMAAEWDSR
ncbi:MAG: hypothetical protein ABSH29_24160 [Acidimicrobiales bacterium]